MHNPIYPHCSLELYIDKDNQVTTDFSKAVYSLDLSMQYQDQLADLMHAGPVFAKKFAVLGSMVESLNSAAGQNVSYGCYFYTTEADCHIKTYDRNGTSGNLFGRLVYPPRPQGALPTEVKLGKIKFTNLQKPIWAYERIGNSPFYDHTPIIHIEGDYQNGVFAATYGGGYHAIVSFHLCDTALFCMSINNFLTDSARFNENGTVKILDQKQYQCFQELYQFFEQRGGSIGIDYRTDSRVLSIINNHK